MISYGKRRRPLTNPREWGRQKKASREQSTQQADKEDIEDTTKDKEDIEDVTNNSIEDIASEENPVSGCHFEVLGFGIRPRITCC